MKKIEQTPDSREVAEMVGKNHADLMRDIRRYCEQFNESNIALVDFFKEADYKDGKGQKRPCYNVTKKGCEFIAHKLTGIRVEFYALKLIGNF
jgi:Rha family phage regulatory protein